MEEIEFKILRSIGFHVETIEYNPRKRKNKRKNKEKREAESFFRNSDGSQTLDSSILLYGDIT